MSEGEVVRLQIGEGKKGEVKMGERVMRRGKKSN
jgi:hypothetical protein